MEKKTKNDSKSPAYYAVIFTSVRSSVGEGYEDTAKQMVQLAENQSGYIGIESYRDGTGRGVTISYWKDSDSIKHWKAQSDHLFAQTQGRKSWYSYYKVRICRIEREYEFIKEVD